MVAPNLKSLLFAFAAVLAITVIGCLYFLYLASTISLMSAMYSGAGSKIMTATQELPQSDFARFWFVGHNFLMQFADKIGFHLQPSPWFLATFKLNILSASVPPVLVWPYPPTMNLLGMLFATLPLGVSFWAWRLFSWGVAIILLRRSDLPWPVVLAGIFAPAELHDLLSGQNGAFTGGLLVCALLTIDRRPVLGGVLSGLLIVKPQIFIAFPCVFFHKRKTFAFFVCALTAGALILISILLEGLQPWKWFFTVAQPASRLVVSQIFFPAGVTILMMARSLGANLTTAWLLQGISSIISAVLLWRCWTIYPSTNTTARMAFTVSLSLLITPYGFSYDLIAFSIAMASLVPGSLPLRQVILCILWLLGGYTLTIANITGIIVMPLAAATGACLAWWQLKPIGGQTGCSELLKESHP